jgi:hypothetical protein
LGTVSHTWTSSWLRINYHEKKSKESPELLHHFSDADVFVGIAGIRILFMQKQNNKKPVRKKEVFYSEF